MYLFEYPVPRVPCPVTSTSTSACCLFAFCSAKCVHEQSTVVDKGQLSLPSA
eukprot:m.1642621 g.1642621  ORF g.1642621 m.1642621 type:complete len:52 (+) comp54261_c0_seq1:62-217(+)